MFCIQTESIAVNSIFIVFNLILSQFFFLKSKIDSQIFAYKKKFRVELKFLCLFFF